MIALIITIIVTVIIASVTLKIALDTGILKLALNASEKYSEEAKNEWDLFDKINNIFDLKTGGEGGKPVEIPDVTYTPEESTYKKIRKYRMLFS